MTRFHNNKQVVLTDGPQLQLVASFLPHIKQPPMFCLLIHN